MRSPRTLSLAASAAVLLGSLLVPAVGWATPDGPEDILPTRATAAVVLTGAQVPEWSRLAATGSPTPYPSGAVTGVRDAHNGTSVVPPDARTGVDPKKVAAYRWDPLAGEFVEIPVQVDERFPYFLANPNSDFGIYSGTDTELTYQWDVESWKMTAGLCAKEYAAGDGPTADPVPTLDDDDEIVVMASDTGAQAPSGQLGPVGTLAGERQELTVADPLTGSATYAYLFLRDGGSRFDETNGYVDYERQPDADQWIDRTSFADDDPEKLGSSNTGYGPNLSGTVCDANGLPRQSTDRFPRDGVTVSTDAYRWSASGRWMVRGMQVAKPGEPRVYGPDLIDRWKGRAFQSSPDSSISVVGFEDEQVNWEANSSLLGERAGPVRAIREVWGADSGTNVTKTETFYRDAVAYRYRLRVHPIPSDGLYTSWDYNAGVATTYFNALRPDGVAIDGVDDEAFGNIDEVGGQPAFFDVPDASFDLPVALLKWEQVSGVGDTGSLVYVLENKGPTTLVNSTVVPFYRDDMCFDDGTGDNPVARPWPGEASTDARVVAAYAGAPCEERQGAWGSHGVHYFATGDTDNAFVGTPVPVNEVDAQQWQFAVPTSAPVAVGEPYAQEVRVPLVTVAASQENTPETAHETSVTITGDRAGQATDGAVLAARLVDDRRGGSPVAGQLLSFSLQGRTISASTDAEGTASVTFAPLAGPAGSRELRVDFGDSDELEASYATSVFDVRAEDTTLSVASPGPTVLTSRLTETDTGGGLGGRVVRFVVGGSEVASATTDAEGRARVVLAKRLKRHDVVEAIFDGDDTYAGSRAQL